MSEFGATSSSNDEVLQSSSRYVPANRTEHDTKYKFMQDPRYAHLTPGYAFYRSIGSPKKVVAPMVEQSELPFRMMTRKYGADLVYSQMYSSNCFSESEEFRKQHFITCPEDRPLIVQFAGHDVNKLLISAQSVQEECDAVDINIGCPQGIAKRGRYGAYLMEELDLLADIVSTLTANLTIPVTCKSRIYKKHLPGTENTSTLLPSEPDLPRSIRLYETLIRSGARLITIHGRTRDEKGYLVGPVDWHMIRQIVTYFNHTVPIIANGGIETIEDYYRCLEITGADGVMSAEGILENPTLFAERSALYPGNAGPDGKYAAEELLIEYRRDICDQIGPAAVEPEASGSANCDGSVSTTSSNSTTTTTFDLYKQVIIAEEYLRFCHSYDYQSITMVKSHLLKILYRYVSRHASIRDMIIKSYTLEAFGGVITLCKDIIRRMQQRQEDSIKNLIHGDESSSTVEGAPSLPVPPKNDGFITKNKVRRQQKAFQRQLKLDRMKRHEERMAHRAKLTALAQEGGSNADGAATAAAAAEEQPNLEEQTNAGEASNDNDNDNDNDNGADVEQEEEEVPVEAKPVSFHNGRAANFDDIALAACGNNVHEFYKISYYNRHRQDDNAGKGGEGKGGGRTATPAEHLKRSLAHMDNSVFWNNTKEEEEGNGDECAGCVGEGDEEADADATTGGGFFASLFN